MHSFMGVCSSWKLYLLSGPLWVVCGSRSVQTLSVVECATLHVGFLPAIILSGDIYTPRTLLPTIIICVVYV